MHMHCMPTGDMSRLRCLYALSMVAVVTHTPYVAIVYGEGEVLWFTLTCNKQTMCVKLYSILKAISNYEYKASLIKYCKDLVP